MASQTQERLKFLLEKEYGAKVDEAKPIGEQYDLDSLGLVEMYMLIEEEFGIVVPEEDRKMKIALDDLVNIVEKASK
jgi:acyl carrier protein